MQKIVLASGNIGKLRELQRQLGHIAEFRPQSDYGIDTPEETGTSFMGNALLKARYVSAKSALPALADDSGLCVDYLKGAPGIYSARFAGPAATDEENNEKLLRMLEEVSVPARTCAFHCALALVFPDQSRPPILCEGIWRGKILGVMRGQNGFGYDPLFQPEGMECSSAELNPDQKNKISHRGQAMAMLIKNLGG